MKSTILRTPLLLGTCLLVAAAPQDRARPEVEDESRRDNRSGQPSAELRTQMETLHREFQQTFNRHDAQAMARLYAQDAILISPDGRELRGRTAIAEFFEERQRERSPRIAIEAVESGGEGRLGWQYGHYTLRFENAAEPIRGYYTIVSEHAAGRGLIKVQVAHPGQIPMGPFNDGQDMRRPRRDGQQP